MPLRDHFRPPLHPKRCWGSFHAGWVNAVADVLNLHLLPEGYFAEAFALPEELPFVGIDRTYSVHVYQSDYPSPLLAVVEFVSLTTKESEYQRRAFVAKCKEYLKRRIGLMVVDIATVHLANLHVDFMAELGQTEGPKLPHTYAVSYRTVVRDTANHLELWAHELTIGETLPTLPLWLNDEICLPIDLEATYSSTYSRGRMP